MSTESNPLKRNISADRRIKVLTNREPPIEYLQAEINGRQCSFFLSVEDYLRKLSGERDFRTEVQKMSDWSNKVQNYVKEKNDVNRE